MNVDLPIDGWFFLTLRMLDQIPSELRAVLTLEGHCLPVSDAGPR